MSNEEIVKEIDEATNLLKEGMRKIRDSLNIARDIAIKDNAADEEAYNKGLEDGRNEVWELIKKLWNLRPVDRDDIFGYSLIGDLVKNFTPQEALAKLEAYEKEQNEIKVGDVIEATDLFGDVFKGIVLDFKDGAENEVFVLDENGCVDVWEIADCKKQASTLIFKRYLMK